MRFFSSPTGRCARAALASAALSLLLVACGGGGDEPYEPGTGSPSGAPTTKGTFTAVVSFGDSLSDVGTYTPATVVPGTDPPVYFGGRFTTNIDGSFPTKTPIWVENIATALSLVITPAEVGWSTQSVKCPAAAQGLGSTCTAYGQGGARVTDANGVRHAAGALTVPLKTQIANHLGAFGSFKATDLVLVQGGNNDAFNVMDPTQPDSFTVAAGTIQARAAAGAITAEQATALLFEARLQAQQRMKVAALELGGYVRDQILAKGARYVVVANMPDLAVTPEGSAYPAAIRDVLSVLSQTFNLWLRESMVNQPVMWVDTAALVQAVVSKPSDYGMVNVSTPACDATKMATVTGGAVTDGFSLFCNASGVAALDGIRSGADIQTWFFADGNHPTVGGHRVISDAVLNQMRAAGWL